MMKDISADFGQTGLWLRLTRAATSAWRLFHVDVIKEDVIEH